MFDTSTYRARRSQLIQTEQPGSGLVLLLGNKRSPMNYGDNSYPFRQDSTFLYYFGLDQPDLAALIDLDEGTSTVFGNDAGLDEIVWTGEQESLESLGARVGVDEVETPARLESRVGTALDNGRSIHILPSYRDEHRVQYASILDVSTAQVDRFVSEPLIRAVAEQRSRKTEPEIRELERALETTARIHDHALRRAVPGTTERQIYGAITGIAISEGVSLSFQPTCSVRGEVLHNHTYANTLEDGDLLLLDAGATSEKYYAGDITRVTPVGGSFSDRQRAVYEAVLAAETAGLNALEPGVPFREVHLIAARELTRHLIDIGLMNGPAEEAVDAGAHALFFPHGLGHMLGLDAHDMENLGEDIVGYAEDQTRSEQFGLSSLRLARPLRTGYVVTVEPGCYFIPRLVEQWRQDSRHESYINYDVVEDFLGLGGVRIEDDAVITSEGARVLGPPIPKSVDDVEARAGNSGYV